MEFLRKQILSLNFKIFASFLSFSSFSYYSVGCEEKAFLCRHFFIHTIWHRLFWARRFVFFEPSSSFFYEYITNVFYTDFNWKNMLFTTMCHILSFYDVSSLKIISFKFKISYILDLQLKNRLFLTKIFTFKDSK